MCSTNEPKTRRSTSPMVNAGSRTILARGNAASHDEGAHSDPRYTAWETPLYTSARPQRPTPPRPEHGSTVEAEDDPLAPRRPRCERASALIRRGRTANPVVSL